jgi:putative tryptophan/tyrosine transport system substrate-binding protein
MPRMGRREFITLLGGAAAAWPLGARGQQPSVQTIGYLSARAADVEQEFLTAFRQGLSETGHVEGRNLVIEYRWAEGRYDRLSTLAAELVRKQVSVIATTGGVQPARAALAATSTIPIVFTSGTDPVKEGLVKSLNRPGGNATGSHVFTTSLGPKRLELLRELVPRTDTIGFLVNPSSEIAEIQVKEVIDAARTFGQRGPRPECEYGRPNREGVCRSRPTGRWCTPGERRLILPGSARSTGGACGPPLPSCDVRMA